MTVENRGTSNTNDRGSAEQRRKRKTWLFEVWGADVDVATPREVDDLDRAFFFELLGYETRTAQWNARLDIGSGLYLITKGLGRPAVRCFRCGAVLDWESVEIDRIKPGCEGGRYTRNNIRPACGPCNKILAGEWVRKRNAKRKAANERRRIQRNIAKAKADYAAIMADVDWSISENADVA